MFIRFLFLFIFILGLNNAKANSDEFKEALNKTTKALRIVPEVKSIERRVIKMGKEYIEDVPFSEEIFATLAFISQPLKLKIDRYQHIEFNYRKNEISYQFKYNF